MFLAPNFFGGPPPEFLKSIYKIQSDSDHLAKFEGDRSRKLGASVAKQKKHLLQNISPSATVVPGGLTMHTSCCGTAVRCPAFVFRVVSSTETSVGTLVNVSCPAGQKLQTGHSMANTRCSRSGDWSPQVSDCVGELHYIRPLRRCILRNNLHI